MSALTATHAGRAYELVEDMRDLPLARADMRSQGWDGGIWYGVSTPTGRQRATFAAVFQRSARTGEFVCVLRK